MPTGTIFEQNGSQAVSLPSDTQFPRNVKKVNVRARGPDRILTPEGQVWDSFFLTHSRVSADFLTNYPAQDEIPQQPVEKLKFDVPCFLSQPA